MCLSSTSNFSILFLREREKRFFTMEKHCEDNISFLVLVAWVAVYILVFSFFLRPTSILKN